MSCHVSGATSAKAVGTPGTTAGNKNQEKAAGSPDFAAQLVQQLKKQAEEGIRLGKDAQLDKKISFVSATR